jgi:site-specific DNA recombinase
MNTYFAYIRVSTVRQGEHGVSLQEQRDAIERYAAREGLTISEWFEEQETAAKRGRLIFSRMLRLLRQGKAHGVLIHKIDRSARNFWDWAALNDLVEGGTDVRFAAEALDLRSRGGRLAADIQAVVAADYIRNLKEEIRKGFYGRLKQGIYPLPAPLGYLDRGAGKPKDPDPKSAPLVRLAFELYATGEYTLATLGAELERRGLRNRRGGKVTRSGLSVFLNNPFYIGLIRIRKTGETFEGAHRPIIRATLFNRVHDVLAGRVATRDFSAAFPYRRLLRCATCRYSLVGERRKGHTYYRCHTPSCPTTSIREEVVDGAFHEVFSLLRLSDEERKEFASSLPLFHAEWVGKREDTLRALRLHVEEIASRLVRLTDAYLDGLLDKAAFEERRTTLLIERRAAKEHVAAAELDLNLLPKTLAQYLDLAGQAPVVLELGSPGERRELIEAVTSDRTGSGRTLAIAFKEPFNLVADRTPVLSGGAYRAEPRTAESLLRRLVEWIEGHKKEASVFVAKMARDPKDDLDLAA